MVWSRGTTSSWWSNHPGWRVLRGAGGCAALQFDEFVEMMNRKSALKYTLPEIKDAFKTVAKELSDPARPSEKDHISSEALMRGFTQYGGEKLDEVCG